MTVLQHQKIKDLCENYCIIHNYDELCIGPASYELRIGSALTLADKNEYNIAIGQEFAIKPSSHLLIGTIEKVNMPDFLVGTMFLKSKFGRGGFLPWGQGLVDPGYEGNLTVSLVNVSPHPQILTGGEKIAHIIFQNLEASTDKPYDGVYKGSQGASGPKERPLLVLGDTVNAVVAGVASGLAQGVVTGS